MESYNCKIIDMGDHFKVIHYGKKIENGFPVEAKKKRILKKNEPRKVSGRKLENREVENFIQLVYMNFKVGDLFITLTYTEKEVSLQKGSRDFENWIKRLRERYGSMSISWTQKC